eukprot:c16835_g1_i1.p1 GENE.c16835_g1_i1~~c16835_g1_i1.p1  ORF type:complete len:996 (+),score=245.22 c16835_g1_i1:75-2990(+)
MDQIFQLLQSATSSDNKARAQAENALKQARIQPGFPQALLQLAQQAENPQLAVVALSAAVNFKNLVKQSWHATDSSDFVIHEQDKAAIKSVLLDVLLSSKNRIQAQLAEALTIISAERFHTTWPELVPNLVERLKTPNLSVTFGVLHVSHSIFTSFRHKFKSDELFGQIKYVVDGFGPTFLNVFKSLVVEIEKTTNPQSPTTDVAQLHLLFQTANMAAKVFLDLNYQDLPEFFEDNLQPFMSGFHVLLTANHPSLVQNSDPNDPTTQIQLHSNVTRNLNLYLQKYDEEFEPYLQQLLSDVWNLLTKCGPEPKYDPLVIDACAFLTTVLTGRSHTLLGAEATLRQICEGIVIPNVTLREADEEMFENDPEEFIRKDIEGSDLETRRRAARDLVKGLLKYFEGPVTGVFTQYLAAILGQQYPDETQRVRAKDASMYLVTAIASKSTTEATGTTEVNQFINILDFFNGHVLPELQSPPDQAPLLKAAALKFTVTFRLQLSSDNAQAIMAAGSTLLESENEVVFSYSANLVEKFLGMKNPQTRQPLFTSAMIGPISKPLLTQLFGVLNRQGENDYVMKAILRISRILQDAMIEHVEMCITQLKSIVEAVCQRPKKPIFNHCLFECISCLIKNIVKSKPETASAFEGILLNPFTEILNAESNDFVPYVVQVLTLLVEVRPKPIPPAYSQLLPALLTVSKYDTPGNVPALVGLLKAYLRYEGAQVVATNQLPPILGVFQFLVSKKAHDHDGLSLLSAVFDHIEIGHLQPLIGPILNILLRRLQSSSTPKFERLLCQTLLELCAKHSGGVLLDGLDSLQVGLSGQILGAVVVKQLDKIVGAAAVRSSSVGAVRLLCQTPNMIAIQHNFNHWGNVASKLVALLNQAQVTTAPAEEEDDLTALEMVAASGQATSTFSKLSFAGVAHADPFRDLPSSAEFFARSLAAACQANPGKIASVVQGLPEAETIRSYLSAVGAQLC